MKKGQSFPEYLFLIAVAIIVAIIIVAVVIKYVEPAAKEVPITGIAYIDPELSPERPEYDHPVTWIVYKYPEGCKAKSTCYFYISVNLHYNRTGDEKYEIFLYANGDKSRIRKIQVLPESEFPCALYIMVWMK